ncbi:predicted protein [Nematostella vectensis]|uniref:Uncharacterized protein n=1 Tax=Nematostella vectensis TaxID=45351 RepID=A7RN82_NEMVE|nr:predicted protein [Nematostella vectensis]|eukprot:XP_001639084.1 predicted protein [Nematostella vectensis]
MVSMSEQEWFTRCGGMTKTKGKKALRSISDNETLELAKEFRALFQERLRGLDKKSYHTSEQNKPDTELYVLACFAEYFPSKYRVTKCSQEKPTNNEENKDEEQERDAGNNNSEILQWYRKEYGME